jgi:hypothetical protein
MPRLAGVVLGEALSLPPRDGLVGELVATAGVDGGLVGEVGGRLGGTLLGGVVLDGVVLDVPVLRPPPRGGTDVIGRFPFAFSLSGCSVDEFAGCLPAEGGAGVGVLVVVEPLDWLVPGGWVTTGWFVTGAWSAGWVCCWSPVDGAG